MKEAWQMTKEEYNRYVKMLQIRQERGLQPSEFGYGFMPNIDACKASNELARIEGGFPHIKHIEKALLNRKPISAKVLKDYPKLQISLASETEVKV